MLPRFATVLSGLVAVAFVHAAPQVASRSTHNTTLAKRFPSDLNFVSLGDSYAAGIGAGKFVPADQLSDGDNHNKCARMDGSYPMIFKDKLAGIVKDFDFFSCSGDVLDDIDAQLGKMLGIHADAVSLSISGNDFLFGKVVKYCVYIWAGTKPYPTGDLQQFCDDLITQSRKLIEDTSATGPWARYRTKVQAIRDHLNPGGQIYVTGYAKFFSPKGSEGDKCHERPFFPGTIGYYVGKLNMLWSTRQKMNEAVDRVNVLIQEQVVNMLNGDGRGSNIHFIDIDDGFEGKRFCEPQNGDDIWGKKEEDVWFLHIGSDIAETGNWEGPMHPDDACCGFDDGNLPEDPENPGFKPRGWSDKLEQNSVFHPKRIAHLRTALELGSAVLKHNLKPEDVVNGGEKFCMGFSPGGGNTCFEVPQDCRVIRPFDNQMPTPFCDDGRDVKLQTVPQ